MKSLKKRIAASLLAVTMAVSSLSFSADQVYAEEATEEIADVITAAEDNKEESALENAEGIDEESGSENEGDSKAKNESDVMEDVAEDDSEENNLEENDSVGDDPAGKDSQEQIDSKQTEINIPYNEEIAGIEIQDEEDDDNGDKIASDSYEDITWVIDKDGKLTVEGNGDFSKTGGYDRAPWYEYRSFIITAEINVSGMTDASYMFCDCENLTEIDVSHYETGQITEMRGMFQECGNLTEIKMGDFDTSQVTDMGYMFSGCKNLAELDVSEFNTSQVRNMSSMFQDCGNLTELDVSKFDISQVTDMSFMFNGCEKLEKLDVSEFDTGQVTNMWGMFSNCRNLEELDVSHFDTSQVTNMSDMFWNCGNLTELNVSHFDTSRVTDMGFMFQGCGNLTELDVSHFDTSQVTYMSFMFNGCENLTELDVGRFDTSQVTAMRCMFYRCGNLTELDLSSFDVSKVTDMDYIFSDCNNLEKIHTPRRLTLSIELPANSDEVWTKPDGNEITLLPQNLTESIIITKSKIEIEEPPEIPVENIELNTDILILEVGETAELNATVTPVDATDSTVTWESSDESIADVEDGIVTAVSSGSCIITASAGDLVAVCNVAVKEMSDDENIASGSYENITWKIDKDRKLTVEGTGDFSKTSGYNRAPWYRYRFIVIAAEVNVRGMTDASYMFDGYEYLAEVDVSEFDTSQVTNMSGMFSECGRLTNIDLSDFDTSQVTNMSSMFGGCWNLTELDVSDFDTSQVTNMSSMFWGCEKLTDLDVSGFDTSQVTDMRYMFDGCGNLRELDLRGFDTSRITRMDGMFQTCFNLKKIDLSSFDTSQVTNMSYMFCYCENLEEIDLSSFDTSQVTDMSGMFEECWSLTKIDLSSFDTGQVTRMDGMFSECGSLISIDLSGFDTSKVTSMSDMFSGCKNLTKLDMGSFDTSQVRNMGYMFGGCENLTEIDMSSFDLSKVTNVPYVIYNMFEYCYNLKIIHTPRNLTPPVELPADSDEVWNQPDGMEITLLPQNLTESIIITKSKRSIAGEAYITATKIKTSYVCGEKLNIDDLTVTYYDGKGASSIVTGYSTNADDIDMSTEGIKELVITYNELTCIVNIAVAKETGNEDPENPEKSEPYITVTKIKTSYVCGEKLNIDDLTVTYYDGKGASSIVTGYSTNADDIDMSTEGIKELVITYNELTYTVNITVVKETESDNPKTEKGIKITLADPGKTYIYTGFAITPAIKVTNNGDLLTANVDYTVKYSNNVKAGTAKITVTGKGNLSGNYTQEFAIAKKRLDNEDIDSADTSAAKIEGDYVTVVEGSKISPVLLYNGVKLTTKEFKVPDEYKTYKWKVEDDNKTITLTALDNSNYIGTRSLTIRVISKAEQKNYKLSVTLANGVKNITYDGQPHDISNLITVSTKNMPSGLINGEDYIISYPNDITSAGTKKFTVVGISGRCIGSVTKSYTIKPKKTEFTVEYDKNNKGYAFVSTGTKLDDLVVKDGNIPLTEGLHYKVSYSGNKKVGTNAKFTVTGLGSYKGSKCTKTFKINHAVLNNNPTSPVAQTDGLEIVAADKVFGKAGVYKSSPYVSINGVLVKSSNYTVTYYLDDPVTNPNARVMDKNNKVTNEGGDTTVWVKVVGKGNYKNDDATCYVTASYKVRSKAPSDSYDLSKAKVTFRDKNGNVVKKIGYTGELITGEDIKAVVTYKIGRETVTLKEGEHYTVTFVNNVNKGKATVIITGKSDQNRYVGSKTATFSIVAGILKNLLG